MKRKIIYTLAMLSLLFSIAYIRFNVSEVKAPNGIDLSKIYGVKMLWNNTMAVNDVAVSKDGNYIVAVNNTGVYYFESDNSTPKWWLLASNQSQYFLSVAASADGEYVVVGDYEYYDDYYHGHLLYFNDSRMSTGERLSPSWKSVNLGGPIERGTLDMSDDGEYVVVGGTGIGLYYFAECSGRSGSGEVPTWYRIFGVNDFLTVHMSSDGSYVAAGGRNDTWEGFVMFYKNANVAPYHTEPDWCSWGLTSLITDLAVSDDGYAVVAIDELVIRTLYYWGNAKTLSGNPIPTWTNAGAFSCVDMSADGDEVVAGTSPLMPCGLHFWADARKRSGPDQAENWTMLTGEVVFDVAISDDGGVIAATTEMVPVEMVSPTKAVIDSYYKAYFFKSDGTMIDEFGLLQFSNIVSMSGDGRITAVGGGIGPDSLYTFELLEDSTPPLIENVHQTPLPDSVYEEDVVMVYANVTDDLSGVKKVILNYTIDDETWFAFEMDNPEGNLYNRTIQGYEYCTTVTYVIMAEDNFNNTVTTEEMGYHVIPEFSPQTILPLFIIATLLMLVIYKKKIHSQRKQTVT